jgi:hypothetical protein
MNEQEKTIIEKTRDGAVLPDFFEIKPLKARIFDDKTLSISPEFTITGVRKNTTGEYFFITNQGELSTVGVFDALHTKDVGAQLMKVHAALRVLKPCYDELGKAFVRARPHIVVVPPTEDKTKTEEQHENTCSEEEDSQQGPKPSIERAVVTDEGDEILPMLHEN